LREIDFPFKNFADRFKPFTFLETSYLNTNMFKFELSQKEQSRAQLTDSSNL